MTTSTGAHRPRVERYDPTEVEPRWQQKWTALGLYRTDLHDPSRPKFYLLTMYPYPSGNLHIGHWYIVTPTDALARYHRMHGQNVFLPIGFDAFGLPAENAAIRGGFHPREWTMLNIENMRRQSGRWGPRSTGTPTSSPATRATTAGTSGSSYASWKRAWRTVPRHQSTGAPTTARSRASRSRAPTGTAGAAARRSRSATSSSGS